jgi:hypothetical protein
MIENMNPNDKTNTIRLAAKTITQLIFNIFLVLLSKFPKFKVHRMIQTMEKTI